MEGGLTLAGVMWAHAARYPLMEAQDWYKLIYQGEFGGGHLIADADAARKRFMDEWEKAGPSSPDELLEEPLGSGLSRIHLRPARTAGILPEVIFDAFLLDAALPCGSDAGMREKLRLLGCFLAEGNAACTSGSLQAYLDGFCGKCFPMQSHSERYRALYRPSYRIIRSGSLRR